jgi:hypothetical protein
MDDFYTALEQALYRVFSYFEYKFNHVFNNIEKFKQWTDLNKILDLKIKNQSQSPLIKFSSENYIFCGISLHGIEELIYQKTHLHIKDQPKNRTLAAEILDFTKTLLQKQNAKLNGGLKYVLSIPHFQEDLIHPPNQILENLPETILPIANKNQYQGYQYGFHLSMQTLNSKLLHKIYQDFGDQNLFELSLATTFPSDLNYKNRDDWLLFFQILLNTKINRLSFSKENPFWQIERENIGELLFGRYFGRYFPIPKK